MTGKLRIKLNCWECRALGFDGFSHTCGLGFKQGHSPRKHGISEPHPLEPCPKPRTYKQWFDALAKSEASAE